MAASSSTVSDPRIIAQHRHGAGSNLAFETAAKAPADGYALLMAQTPLAVNVTLYPKLAYDAVRDLDPVILAATTTNVLVTHPSVPARTVQ